ncbi:hypothetical protein BV898_00569 [Hypsibius exemplaris]|uniref:Nerve growth factor-related domain-containing protein n=1 Tax=Hypsibius exemplaris TaxID=2072580 RepID=A0A1W0XDT9_HYPEX|nr:hypothetical protein BV898_00569 [Hypsibius exemplaris]
MTTLILCAMWSLTVAVLSGEVEAKPTGSFMHAQLDEQAQSLVSGVPVARAICRTESAWTKLDTAMDLYGNPVKVLHTFRQNDALVEQMFHEKFCAPTTEEDSSSNNRSSLAPTLHSVAQSVQTCYGIDEARFRGVCLTKYSYVYARVQNQRGVIGWNAINIRGGCECALFPRARA